MAMKREDMEAREATLLAPWAMRSAESRGRHYSEEEHRVRTAFQRDRDRVIHSAAFRRLEYKTQVFVNHEGDYYRTRLTHTMEAAQITRSVARALRLNEDLAEAIVLAHDLGHTPFGHAGERVLDGLMEPYGGFEHNAQSLRIVERLEERYPDFPGLNLTWEVREGIVKHSSEYDRPLVRLFDPAVAPTLEAQVADFADEIAYNCHDIDDGLQSGMLAPGEMEEVSLWREHFAEARSRSPEAPFSILRYQTVRRILDAMVSDLVGTVEAGLATHSVETIDDLRAVRPRIARYSDEMGRRVRELKSFLMDHLYMHVRVTRMGVKARTVLTGLFQQYFEEPRQMPAHVHAHIERGEDKARVIADYVAGMTDRFALEEYKKLFDPLERV
ncbi:MAG: deoxyguanosinetriphosphate triphosphohydrolase [Deltaproteobacteria bacterium]|nr:deoxyguanosinetriphosphate triphosphohydrolase [Deltaproteobacteria bacterium]